MSESNKPQGLQVQFETQVTEQDLMNFKLYHNYHSVGGVAGLLFGIVALIICVVSVGQVNISYTLMISDRRVEHPLDVVSVGDIVDVRVIEVDANKGRIALSMILDEKEAQNKKISRPAKDRRTKKDRPKKQEGLNLSGLSKFMH